MTEPDGSFWTLPVQVGAFTAIAVLAYVRVIRGRTAVLVLWAAVAVPLAVRLTALRQDPPAWLVVVMEGSGLHRAHLLVAGVVVWLWARRRIDSLHMVLLQGLVLLAQTFHPPMEDSVAGLAVMLVLICLAARGPDWDLHRDRRELRILGQQMPGDQFKLSSIVLAEHDPVSQGRAAVAASRGCPFDYRARTSVWRTARGPGGGTGLPWADLCGMFTGGVPGSLVGNPSPAGDGFSTVDPVGCSGW